MEIKYKKVVEGITLSPEESMIIFQMIEMLFKTGVLTENQKIIYENFSKTVNQL